MAFACSFISSSVLPTTGVKPPACRFSSSTNKSYVFKKSANNNNNVYTTRGNIIRCDFSTTDRQQNLGGLPSTTSIPQNGQKGDNKPPTPALIIRPDELHRSYFPDDFIFGAGTSAIQIEGNGKEGGRGPSTGDYLIGKGKGVDSYHKFKEDVMLLKELGIPYYRFSIAWPRILPDGTLDHVNRDGVRYYNNLLDELERHEIKPFVTLFHFDQPEALQKRYNGFMDRRIIQDFTNYCDLCFKLFGDRVQHWITINEAATFLLFTDMCLTQEQRKDPLNQFIAGHHLLLCHAAVSKLYKDKYKNSQHGEVGMSIVSKWFEPRSPSPIDQEAAHISFDFLMGWFMHPLKYGDYPANLKKWVRGLPEFTEEEKSNLKDSCDFFGINYYTAAYTTTVLSGQMLINDGVTDLRYLIVEKDERDGTLIGPEANGVYKINIYPDGLRKLLLHVKTFYGNQKMYITENGCCSYPKITMSIPKARAFGKMGEIERELNDDQRLEYFQLHLHQILQAINEDEANVKGYIFWSLLDNNEFGNYDVRFGLGYVDYHDDHKRYVKKSGKWYADFLSDKRRRVWPELMSEAAAKLSEN